MGVVETCKHMVEEVMEMEVEGTYRHNKKDYFNSIIQDGWTNSIHYFRVINYNQKEEVFRMKTNTAFIFFLTQNIFTFIFWTKK